MIEINQNPAEDTISICENGRLVNFAHMKATATEADYIAIAIYNKPEQDGPSACVKMTPETFAQAIRLMTF